MSAYLFSIPRMLSAIMFLQSFDNRTPEVQSNSNYKSAYAWQKYLSSGLKNTGTNNLSVASRIDKICNIYDMADNCSEMTTELCSASSYPFVSVGGLYGDSDYHTCYRAYGGLGAGYSLSFRPILYLE